MSGRRSRDKGSRAGFKAISLAHQHVTAALAAAPSGGSRQSRPVIMSRRPVHITQAEAARIIHAAKQADPPSVLGGAA